MPPYSGTIQEGGQQGTGLARAVWFARHTNLSIYVEFMFKGNIVGAIPGRAWAALVRQPSLRPVALKGSFWHMPEVPAAGSEGRLRFQSGLRQWRQMRAYEFTASLVQFTTRSSGLRDRGSAAVRVTR